MSNYLPFTDQLNLLFTIRQTAHGRPYTLQEVSAGTGISPATLSQMRTGRIKNPQFSTVRALCRFFAIPLSYFETRSAEECYALLVERSALAETEPLPEITELTLRATQLSREAQQDILTIIRWILAAERNQGSTEAVRPPMPRLTDRSFTERDPVDESGA